MAKQSWKNKLQIRQGVYNIFIAIYDKIRQPRYIYYEFMNMRSNHQPILPANASNTGTFWGVQAEENAFTSEQLTKSFFEKQDDNPGINAFITATKEQALAQAKASDARRKKGASLGEIDGIPLAIKDNFCTNGILTTAASKMLHDFVPPYESFVTQKLLDAGAVFVGKTNMDEFGMGSSTEKSFFSPTLNPVARDLGLGNLVPGGSSGGSAAAVAAGFCAAAIGTDTGGSIRQPASFCGLVGMKPTYGRCSRNGIIAYASSLEQAGVIARNVDDAATLLRVIAGFDPNDSTSLNLGSDDFRTDSNIDSNILGVPKQFYELKLGGDLVRAWSGIFKAAEKAGFEIKVVDIPGVELSLPAYYIIALSEASSNLARYDGARYGYRTNNSENLASMYLNSRSEGFGQEVKTRILMGTYCLSSGYYDAYYLKAQKLRRLISESFKKAFEECSAMIWPTTPSTAFEVGKFDSDPVAMYAEDIFTVPVNLAGLPALSLPIATGQNGMPMGATIAAPVLEDGKVLSIASKLEGAMV